MKKPVLSSEETEKSDILNHRIPKTSVVDSLSNFPEIKSFGALGIKQTGGGKAHQTGTFVEQKGSVSQICPCLR